MKQLYKTLWIASLSLLLIGGLTIGVSLAMGGVKAFDQIQNARYQEKTITLDKFKNLKLDLTSLRVDIVPSEDDQVHLTYYHNTEKNLDFVTPQLLDGHLTLKENYEEVTPVINLGKLLEQPIKSHYDYGQITLKVPADWRPERVEVLGGSDFYLHGLTFENTEITFDYNIANDTQAIPIYYGLGQVTLSEINFKQVTLRSHGNLDLVQGKIENTRITAGRIHLGDMEIKDSQLNAQEGSIGTLESLSWLGDNTLTAEQDISLLDDGDFATINLELTMARADVYQNPLDFPVPKDFPGELKAEGKKLNFVHHVQDPTSTIKATSKQRLVTLDFGEENRKHYDLESQSIYYHQ